MEKKYYGYYNSPIGMLEIITSDSAVASISFSDDKKTSADSSPILSEAIKQLDEYFKGIRKEFSLKLQLEGTDFQKRVWTQLMSIPYGNTISYKELAVNVGNVKATRAVGGANNKNKLPIVIPCHRVIGANGELTGYAGGLDKKKWLLEHESRL